MLAKHNDRQPRWRLLIEGYPQIGAGLFPDGVED